jgi:hypothetical protein
LPDADSIDGIYDILKHQAVIHKSGAAPPVSAEEIEFMVDEIEATPSPRSKA